MIKIEIVSYNGHPPAQATQAEFDEMGGTIGRADGNALVLPDPERYVSRNHATIAFRSGGYVIRDLSSASPVQVNGQALGNGREAVLAGGDEIRIGGYLLRVLVDTPRAAPPLPAGRPAAPAAAPRDDPLAMFGPSAGDPFADLLSPAPPPLPGRAQPDVFAGRPDAPLSHQTIPTDFDPFADLMAPPPPVPDPFSPPASPPRLPDDFNLGLAPASSQNIDQLFGLNAGSSADPFAGAHPLGNLGAGADASSSLDPLVAMGAVSAPPIAPATQRDNSMEIRAAFSPPPVSFPEPAQKPPPQPVAAPATPPLAASAPPPLVAPPDTKSMLFSWNASDSDVAGGEIRTVIVPSARVVAPAPPRVEALQAAAESPALPASAAPRVDPPPLPRPPAAQAPAGAGAASGDELLRAFLAGAGVPDLDLPEAMSPQLMNRIGQLLRTSTQGTLDLLLARALIKREVRAEVTMIVARENNPLKFSPNVDVALSHLLAPRGQGFMTPTAAMKDACDDLRAHQFGFMAGMRAALDGVLRRFDPVQLEQRLTDKSFVDSMLPMNRKAKLWALFSELYADINKEAQDDFHALFGKEFLRAYESQLDQLDKQASDAPVSGKR